MQRGSALGELGAQSCWTHAGHGTPGIAGREISPCHATARVQTNNAPAPLPLCCRAPRVARSPPPAPRSAATRLLSSATVRSVAAAWEPRSHAALRPPQPPCTDL
eukprot:589379-Rhodomonas_salina.5